MAKKKEEKKATGPESWVAVLIQGRTYRGGKNGEVYKKGVSYSVSAKTAKSLMASGHFTLNVATPKKEEESKED